jgi:NOL1/NOP2/fmu family ribosome biogenesis protein
MSAVKSKLTAKELRLLEQCGKQEPSSQFHADYNRWLDMHSWYKHISLSGETFVMCRGTGEQQRNGIYIHVTDISGVHLHFFVKHIFERYRDKLARENIDTRNCASFVSGPFMTQNTKTPHGFHIIYEKATPVGFEKWLETTHPSLQPLYDNWIEADGPYRHEFISALYTAENEIYYKNFCKALELLTSA